MDSVMDLYFQSHDQLQIIKNSMCVGLWTIELDTGMAPKMYADKVMRGILGVPDTIAPEDCYTFWYSRIFSSHIYVVEAGIQDLLQGKAVEITYPWMNAQGKLSYVRCGGERDFGYENGIRLCGYHQDITKIVLEEKQKADKPVVSDHVLQVLCSAYTAVHLVDFRTMKVYPYKVKNSDFWNIDGLSVDEYMGILSEYVSPKQRKWIRDSICKQMIVNEEGEDSFYCVRESRYQKDGQEYWYNVILGIDQNNANMSMVVAFQDISEHKQAANTIEQLRFQSEMDGLTKILNRATIEQHIKRYLDHEPKVPCAVALLDLDNFKQVNDVMGHSKGDFVLIETAEKLKQICRKTDEVGRLGGDEFMVFLKDVSQDQIYELAARMVNGLRMDVETQDGTITVTVSVGVACYPQDGKTFTELYCNADHALYTSKHAGKGQFTIYGQR